MYAAKRCIRTNDGIKHENAVILTSGIGRQIGEDIPLGANGGHIDIPKGKPNSLIVVHNHWNSSPFSYTDFVLANNNPEIKVLLAVGHNGTVYKLSVKNGKRLDISEKKSYDHYRMDFQRRYNIETGDHEALVYYATSLGWEYDVM